MRVAAAFHTFLTVLEFCKASEACHNEKGKTCSSLQNSEGRGLCPISEPVCGEREFPFIATNTIPELITSSSSISAAFSHSYYSEAYESSTDTPTTSISESANTPSPSFTGKMEESFNYASFDCGALIRAANKESTHSTSILQNSKDAYMLNPCSADKYVEIEVCQTILVKEITLANFEFFSSQFREFSVYGSSKLPPDWVLLGNYSAKNVRDRQHFTIKDPKIWSKHVRIHFLSHYGSEFYCPLTSIQIFGTTMLDDPIISSPSVPVASTTVAIEKSLATTSSNEKAAPTGVESVCFLPVLFTAQVSMSTYRPSETATVIESERFDTMVKSTSSLPPSPSIVAQQESVFAKIIHRIAQLEMKSSALDGEFLNLQAIVNQSREDSLHRLKEYESLLLVRIEEQVSDW